MSHVGGGSWQRHLHACHTVQAIGLTLTLSTVDCRYNEDLEGVLLSYIKERILSAQASRACLVMVTCTSGA